ncbi:Zn-dependent oligopeptidase [Catenulispora sp. MAP12-49]|uniref:hypothetical protein n=1 Tax=unclassified Catenulispora TaxID=414885 RepID=UPI003513C854
MIYLPRAQVKRVIVAAHGARVPRMVRHHPDYANVTPGELALACRAALDDCDARIAALIAIPAEQRTFENTVVAVEEARAAVTEARAAWGLLAEVSPDKDLRGAAQEWAERLDKRTVGIGLDEQVFRAVREYANGTQAPALTGVDARLLGDLQRDYQRSGIGLPTAQRERLRVLFDELVELGSGFTATLAGWRDGIVVDRDELAGLPEAYIEGLERVGDCYRV